MGCPSGPKIIVILSVRIGSLTGCLHHAGHVRTPLAIPKVSARLSRSFRDGAAILVKNLAGRHKRRRLAPQNMRSQRCRHKVRGKSRRYLRRTPPALRSHGDENPVLPGAEIGETGAERRMTGMEKHA